MRPPWLVTALAATLALACGSGNGEPEPAGPPLAANAWVEEVCRSWAGVSGRLNDSEEEFVTSGEEDPEGLKLGLVAVLGQTRGLLREFTAEIRQLSPPNVESGSAIRRAVIDHFDQMEKDYGKVVEELEDADTASKDSLFVSLEQLELPRNKLRTRMDGTGKHGKEIVALMGKEPRCDLIFVL